MKIAETVTFGGSGLDRADHLRRDTKELGRLMQDPSSEAIVFWRGKPLIRRGTRDALARVSPQHPVTAPHLDQAIFLGLEEGQARFAVNVTGWQPDDLDAEALAAFLDPSEQQHPEFEQTDVFAELRANMTRLNARDAELAATARAIFEWHRTHGFCATCGEKSEIANAGWQRDCPACGRNHFPRVDPVVIMLITYGNSVLVGRSHGWPEGMYSLLAGFIEPGETIEAAVRREVFEEAGVRVGEVGYLASQPWPFPGSLMLGCQGRATSDGINVDPVEIDDAIWVSREEMMTIFASEHETILPARKGSIAHFLLENWLADRLD
ncbi:MAG: NAD(+) diphosphatase [Pseudomonadota bacterium]